MPDTPVTQVKVPRGKVTSMFFEIVLRCAADRQAVAVARPPLRGHGDAFWPRRGTGR